MSVVEAAYVTTEGEAFRSERALAQLVARRLLAPARVDGARVFSGEALPRGGTTRFLSRFDPRDTLLVRHRRGPQVGLHIVVSAGESTQRLEETLRGLLPGDTTLILRADGSTDSVERLRDFLVSNDFDGTIVPQWLLGEISRATFPDRFLADGIASLRRMVLPLSRHTPAPGQGVVLFDSPISNLDDPAHCPETERACLREAASVSAGDPPTILSRSFGTVVFGDRDSSGLRRLSIESVAPALPKALSRDVVWPPENGSSEAITRTPLPLPPIEISPEIGFIVSKAEAWPASFVVPDTTVVLVPGDASWCKLSAQGIFVGGSFDSLGEGELTSLKAAFPRVRRWMKLGHSEGVETAEVTLIPTYRVAASSEAPQLNGFTHFFWRSGSQFERYLAANPQLLSCFHGSGPGHTAATIRRRIPNPAQSSVYGSFEDFIHQVI